MSDKILSITDKMINTLDAFFKEKTIIDVDRNSYLVCNLDDSRLKIKISLVFMRDWDSIESDNYNSVILENKGAVFTFPCYWVSVPKELAMVYFEFIINEFYETEVSTWSIAKGFELPNSQPQLNNNGDQNQIINKPQCPIINGINV